MIMNCSVNTYFVTALDSVEDMFYTESSKKSYKEKNILIGRVQKIVLGKQEV